MFHQEASVETIKLNIIYCEVRFLRVLFVKCRVIAKKEFVCISHPAGSGVVVKNKGIDRGITCVHVLPVYIIWFRH